PSYATEKSAGLDLYAAIEDTVSIHPGCRHCIKTGIKIELPEGYEAQIRPRSGLAAKFGVTVLNAPGTIDADYRGEIAVILINFGSEVYKVNRGDRIAQMVISEVVHVSWKEAESIQDTERGHGGFGSTGS
ncbi:unnamed protein product, partial [Ixodes pacificus]